MKRILVYVRPWNREQFIDLAEKVFPDSRLTLLSEHASADSSGFVTSFTSAYDRQERYKNEKLWAKLDMDDVILRCRLLRNIERSEAERLVEAMAATLENMAERNSFDAILSTTTDSYIQHLMVVFAQSAGIPFIGLVPTFVNGYFRITRLGELNECRTVSSEEVERIQIKLLSKDYRPSFLFESNRLLWNARKQWAKTLVRPIYFRSRRAKLSNRLNYHYWASEVHSRRRLSIFPQTYSGLNLGDLERLVVASCNVPLVYIPLQMSPEATVDYWSSDSSWIDYEARILGIIDQYTASYSFVVKEHPNVLGLRSSGFYKKLAKRSNVFMIDPSIPSNLVLELCEAVVVCTGSVGFEAFLRGIPVLSDSDPWYAAGFVQPVSALNDGVSAAPLSGACISDGVNNFSRGILPGIFHNAGKWNQFQYNQEAVAHSISEAIPFLGVSAFQKHSELKGQL